MYFVYILKSQIGDHHYIGHSNDIDNRVKQHNSGKTTSTKRYMPWSVIYVEPYQTKAEAYKREMEIKSYKGGILFKKLTGEWKQDI